MEASGNVKLQVDARVNSRLVARQNQGLRKQLSLVAVRTTHVRYKLVAFLGWRFVVRWRKSEDTGVEQVRFEREWNITDAQKCVYVCCGSMCCFTSSMPTTNNNYIVFFFKFHMFHGKQKFVNI